MAELQDRVHAAQNAGAWLPNVKLYAPLVIFSFSTRAPFPPSLYPTDNERQILLLLLPDGTVPARRRPGQLAIRRRQDGHCRGGLSTRKIELDKLPS